MSEKIELKPIDILLFCPNCAEQHIDEPQPEKDWTNPPHKTHECQFCGHLWRPSDVPTNGVLQTTTKGKSDGNPRPRYFATAKDFNDSVAELEAEIERLREELQGYKFADEAGISISETAQSAHNNLTNDLVKTVLRYREKFGELENEN